MRGKSRTFLSSHRKDNLEDGEIKEGQASNIATPHPFELVQQTPCLPTLSHPFLLALFVVH